MSNLPKVEDLILQDASTLLMFANAAAKQQHESTPPPPSSSAEPQHQPQPLAKVEKRPASHSPPSTKAFSISNIINQDLRSPPLMKFSSAPQTTHSSISEPKPLPIKGSFTASPAPPEKSASPTYSHHSPGPANVALARGINMETGERNASNAVIAAAALAAAADIPLPLLKKSLVEKVEDPATEEEDDEEKVKQEPNQLQSAPEIVAKEPKHAFVVPPLEEFQVDPDSGLIGCICGIEDDDGFTIQCDVCFRWQHCLCMGYNTSEEVPEDEYKCYYCDESKHGKIDAELCRKSTLARLEHDKMDDIEAKPPAMKRKHLMSGTDDKKRKVAKPNEKVPVKKEDLKKESEIIKENVVARVPTPVQDTSFLPCKDNELLDDGMSAEFYQSVYYRLRKNDYKRYAIKTKFQQLGTEFRDKYSNNLKIEVMTLQQFNEIQFSKIILPNHQKYLQERNEFKRSNGFNSTSIQIKSYGDNPKQKFNGVTRLGLFISKRTEQDPSTIPAHTPVVEYLGEIDFFDNYRDDKINQYGTWGTVKPRVLKTQILTSEQESVDVVLDSRFVGNEARFIRKSCPDSTNCYVKPVYLSDTNSFRFLVYTSKPIILGESNEEELRLGWEWDPKHPILKMYEQENDERKKFDQFSDEDKSLLISGIDNILHFVECGCTTSNVSQQCAIFKIKKATSYLLRSTRKASGISNIHLAKSRDEIIKPKKGKEFISWNERLVQRDQLIQMSLSVTAGKAEDEIFNDEDEEKQELKQVTVSLKEQIASRGKKLAQELTVGVTEKTNTMVLPVVGDAVVKVKSEVDKQIKPTAPPAQETPEVAPVQVPVVKEAPPTEKAPVVKKKLSFADYKKKMK